MGKETNIEWCDSTVNPTDFQCCGCELWNKNVHDCYAGRFAERRAGKGAFDKPVVMKPGRMKAAANWSDLTGTKRPDKPWLDGRPRVIFVGDMADTLQPGVSFDYLKEEIIDVVTSEAGKRHIWMWLTKQAKRLLAFNLYLDLNVIDWPPNLWPGVTVTADNTTWRIDQLVKLDATTKFVSYEPAWGPVDFSRWTCRSGGKDDDGIKQEEPSHKIALIITGGQSGSKRMPYNLNWAYRTIDVCQADDVHCFVKQLGSAPVFDQAGLSHPCPIKLKDSKGGDWYEWPKTLRVRQFPEA